VSFKDGKKYNYSKAEQQRLRDTSDRLCREYGLSVIEHGSKAPSRPVWLDEKNGEPTRYNIYRADVEDAIFCSNNVTSFERYLVRKGYEVDLSGAHWRIKLPQYQHFSRMDTLDRRWTPQGIQAEIGRAYHSLGSRPAYVTFSPYMPPEFREYYTPFHPTSHIRKLYLYYSYQLGILPKKCGYKPTSPYLKEDLRKLDEICAQSDYLAWNKIETIDELLADREKLQAEMECLLDQRRKLQNKIRRAAPEEKETLREEKQGVTIQIANLRKRLKLNFDIEERSAKIQETMDMVYANENRNKQLQRERVRDRCR
jgi:hypothetical protein